MKQIQMVMLSIHSWKIVYLLHVLFVSFLSCSMNYLSYSYPYFSNELAFFNFCCTNFYFANFIFTYLYFAHYFWSKKCCCWFFFTFLFFSFVNFKVFLQMSYKLLERKWKPRTKKWIKLNKLKLCMKCEFIRKLRRWWRANAIEQQ